MKEPEYSAEFQTEDPILASLIPFWPFLYLLEHCYGFFSITIHIIIIRNKNV